MKHRWISLVLFIVIALAGCVPPQPNKTGQESDPMEPQAPHPTSGVVEVSPLPTPTADSALQPTLALSDPTLKALITKSTDDLAQRLSIPADQIKLEDALEVTWSDSSLGCPNPESLYLQVLTPGYLLRFQAMDKVFEYHTDKTNNVIYCDNPTVAPSGTIPDR